MRAPAAYTAEMRRRVLDAVIPLDVQELRMLADELHELARERSAQADVQVEPAYLSDRYVWLS